ncbi:MAG TPA: MBL fold metallo-hydrolase [Candidatus Acidoferrales bacterium]|nr:MBL fold metallo-hydrolase [Candidatus Acidoferrales bacterium]
MTEELIHEILPVGLLQCNCSILGDRATGEAIVVDPGDEVDRILEVIGRSKLKVRAIVSTHTHIDHVGGLAALQRATGAPVLIHEDDLALYGNLDMQARWLGIRTPEMIRIHDFVKEGDAVRWGGFAARVLHTPGHTPGSISLVVDRSTASSEAPPRPAPALKTSPKNLRLIAGDTLFRGSIGRTDLPGGSFADIMSSIREKLLALPDDVPVFPGHGDITTIGAERATNPFLR